ncbi:pheA operon leader peptide PheL [Salmonella enterica]|nr:pheA operon leader peptide PheL [Salmonella enterica]
MKLARVFFAFFFTFP